MNANSWQTRIAITRNGKLQNIYFSSPTVQRLERSFFKGKVTKILPGIQTAFVDIGQERAGFLHISEIDRELAIARMSGVDLDDEGQDPPKLHELDISKIFQEGENILIQVSKEPVYKKGAKLTTCFTLPGRFLVLLPNIPRLAISKKIEDHQERARLKELLSKQLPDGMGAIIRTNADGAKDRDIKRDLRYLVDTWNQLLKAYSSAKVGEKVYEDLPLVMQIIRDNLDDDVEAVICDNPQTQKEAYSFVKQFMAEHAHVIKLYRGPQALFEKYEIEKQIEQASYQKIELKSGGSIIIETTQAMTVIDVNTGRYIGKSDMEKTLLQTNLEAAEEIVRQLRLRNIGGLIVIDFIDLAIAANRQKLFLFFEKTLKEQDRFQSVVLRISEFGLVQMTRKRSGKTLLQEIMTTCPTCESLGMIKSTETFAYSILNYVKEKLQSKKLKGTLYLTVSPSVFEYINNVQYNSILSLEKIFDCKLLLESDKDFKSDKFNLEKKS